jgi:hypothetical protein
MKQTEIMKNFGVSRTTIQNWKTAGCPVDGDVGDIAAWRTRRHFEHKGADFLADSGLPELHGEVVRRLADLDRRIELVNAWPEKSTCEPGLFKAAVVSSLILEQELLALPGRIIGGAKPETAPEDIHRIVLAAHDRARGEGNDDDVQDDKTRHVRRDTERSKS